MRGSGRQQGRGGFWIQSPGLGGAGGGGGKATGSPAVPLIFCLFQAQRPQQLWVNIGITELSMA